LKKPEIVCICGSTKFEHEWHKAETVLELGGYIVLSIGFGLTKFNSQTKRNLDELHKRKIDLCDWIFVLNVGGYIGRSTKSEIDYATKLGKEVVYLEEI